MAEAGGAEATGAEAGGALSALQPRLAALGRRLAALRGTGGDGALLAKGFAALDKLKDFCNEGKEHPSTLLQVYTQAVLDITYFEENQLVDEDFPEQSSMQKVKELICILSEPEDLVRECSIFEEPINILGTEFLECLYWRKGALLYMYCHAAKERSEWLQENIVIFRKCLIDGVHYLMKMLSFRCPLQLNDDVLLQDKDTARLLSEDLGERRYQCATTDLTDAENTCRTGYIWQPFILSVFTSCVFSDTHLLAMMYSGEMCFWGLRHCGEVKQEKSLEKIDSISNSDLGCRSQSVSLDFRETGKNLLTKYVAVCEGPLKGHGWNTTTAKQMLCYFVKSHN